MKNILFLALAIATTNVMAEWMKVSEQSDLVMYIDPATVRKTEQRAKMWTLKDYKIGQISGEDKYFSSKSRVEFDCEEEQMRTISFVLFFENMGAGRVINSASDPNRPWNPVLPDSVGHTLWRIACEPI